MYIYTYTPTRHAYICLVLYIIQHCNATHQASLSSLLHIYHVHVIYSYAHTRVTIPILSLLPSLCSTIQIKFLNCCQHTIPTKKIIRLQVIGLVGWMDGWLVNWLDGWIWSWAVGWLIGVDDGWLT